MSHSWVLCSLVLLVSLAAGCAKRVPETPMPKASAAAPETVLSGSPVLVPVDKLGSKYQLVGRTGQPLFKFVRIQGVVVDGPHKGYEGGPNVRIQRINGVATQEDIQLSLRLSDPEKEDQAENRARNLTEGGTYEFAGYESGDFVGTPLNALGEAGIENNAQTQEIYLSTQFVSLRTKRIEPVGFTPADFLGREALLQGTAATRDGKRFIDGTAWRLLLPLAGPWPKATEGKAVEVWGTVRHGDNQGQYRIENGTSRLVRLEDQVGQQVTLRGTAWSLNGHWWFDYRGQSLYVENLETFGQHGSPTLIRGTLERAKLPEPSRAAREQASAEEEQFIVRNASWEALDRLLAPERPAAASK